MSDPLLFAGSASEALASDVVGKLGIALGLRTLTRFPDGELHLELHDSARGRDVYLLQSTCPPVEQNLMELLLLADASRRAGAARLTAVVPYFGYARQDRRAGGREPVGARLVADLLQAARVDRLVAVDLHSGALEGVFSMPLEHLTARPLLADAVRPYAASNAVVVAPDLGAAKLADDIARRLQLPMVVVHKTRLSGSDVAVRALTGEVRDQLPIVVDDMITTGATVEAAVHAVLAAGALPEAVVAATHGLFVGAAEERLRALPIRCLVVTDSVAATPPADVPLQKLSLARLLATAVGRLHGDTSLAELLVHA